MILHQRERLEKATKTFLEKNLGDLMGKTFNERDGSTREGKRLGGLSTREKPRLCLVESSRNLLVSVTIQIEDLAKMGQLLVKIFLITDVIGSHGKGLKNASFLARVVMRRRMKVEIGVGSLAINPTTKRTIRFLYEKNVKRNESWLSISSSLVKEMQWAMLLRWA